MGKRELLLVTAFLVVGFVVYQVTAPKGEARARWSFSGIIEQVRREVRGNQARAEATKTQTIPAPAALREIRIANFPAELAVVGEDRADILAELKVTSRGYDDAEAKRTAEATKVNVDPAGELVAIAIQYPPEGRQSAILSLRVPKRFTLRIDDKTGKLTVVGIAGVTLGNSRGQTVLTDIAGPVQGTQRGSSITLTNVGALRLNTVQAETRISKVRGNSTFNFQGGEIEVEQLEGGLEVEARNAEIKFDKIEKVVGPVRINATGGQIAITGLTADTRIDGRRTEIRVEHAAAAPLAIYNETESIEVTIPSVGYDIDALSVIGPITLDDALQKAGLEVTSSKGNDPNGPQAREEWRLIGKVRGGGPKLTLRSTRGDIRLRVK